MKPTDKIHKSWLPLINHLLKDERFEKIRKSIGSEFFPSRENIFTAFSMPVNEVRAVIVALSPYKADFANGIAMSTDGRATPTLEIICEALASQYNDITVNDTFDFTLQKWINQGILLLNLSLTVPKNGGARDHVVYWYWFVEGVIKAISEQANIPIALLGRDAEKLDSVIPHEKVKVCCHPMATKYRLKDYDFIYNIPLKYNFVKQNMFLWFDSFNLNINWYE